MAEATIEGGAELGGRFAVVGHAVSGFAALAAGDVATAHEAREAALPVPDCRRWWHGGSAAHLECRGRAGRRGISPPPAAGPTRRSSTTTGLYLMRALTTRARVAIAQGEPEQAERDAHDALACAADMQAHSGVADILECLADLDRRRRQSPRSGPAVRRGSTPSGNASGEVRFKVYDAGYEASVAALRDAMGEKDFDSAWAEGAALSTEEAIAYAQRGRGERKRPTSGWASLTPTERDVVRLVSEGLAQQRHRHTAFRLTAHRANPPHPRLHQTRAHLARATRPRSSPPHLT